MKKIPQRTCIGCKEKKEKRELIRIVKDKAFVFIAFSKH